MRKPSVVCSLILLCLATACGRYPLNKSIAKVQPDQGYRYRNLAVNDPNEETFIVLAFSGGGHRAAALAYGVLEELHAQQRACGRNGQSMLDEVDVISSVSGGSFTAAYYGLHGNGIFDTFEKEFLNVNIQSRIIWSVVNPVNWFRLMSPGFNRIHLAAELYDKKIFDHHTFKDLSARGRPPFIVLNATDMSVGSRFEFTQDQFDLLCSDLSSYPVASAVAASSAFPIAFSPLTLKNYQEGCWMAKPDWFSLAQNDFFLNKRRYHDEKRLESYWNPDRGYVHLLDGGVSDNLGLRGTLHSLTSEDVLSVSEDTKEDRGWNLTRMMNLEQLRRLVVLSVNARKDAEKDWDKKSRAPGVGKVQKVITGVPMGNYSYETVESIKSVMDEREAARRTVSSCQKACEGCDLGEIPKKVDYYFIEVGFDAVPFLNDPRFSAEFFQNLPTSFSLPPETIDALRAVGREVLRKDPEYARLLADLAKDCVTPE